MATSLLLACGLNEQNLDPYIHISEDSGADSSFLLSSILGQRLRVSNSAVVIVCLHHTYQHYLNVGMRLGYNLNMFKDKNLSVIDPISDIGGDFLNCNWLSAGKNIVELLLKDIKKEINDTFADKLTVTVIIDSLSILLNLEVSKEDIIKLPQVLRLEAEGGPNVTVITKLENSDVLDVVDNNLTAISDLHIKIGRLKSGNFKEVDGKLIVNKIFLEGDYDIKRSEKSILYKVDDRKIKIFNPGEVGVKV